MLLIKLNELLDKWITTSNIIAHVSKLDAPSDMLFLWKTRTKNKNMMPMVYKIRCSVQTVKAAADIYYGMAQAISATSELLWKVRCLRSNHKCTSWNNLIVACRVPQVIQTIEKDSLVLLHILHSVVVDSGIYTVTAKNDIGEYSGNINVIVQCMYPLLFDELVCLVVVSVLCS